MDQCRDRSTEVYQEIRWFDIVDNALKDTDVIFKIPCTHQSHVVQAVRKDVGDLVYRRVMNHVDLFDLKFYDMLETTVQKEDLQIESPSFHITVEILQIRIVFYSFKLRFVT